MTTDTHLVIQPSILYCGTPVVLLPTDNADGTADLAPISSAWSGSEPAHLLLPPLPRPGRRYPGGH